MALNWSWNEKCGEIAVEYVLEGQVKEYTINLYQGNAFLIMLHEFTNDEGTEQYEMYGFFLDKDHMKRCLGIAKGTMNIYKDGYQKWTKVRINKKKYCYTKDLVEALVKAFDDITIEICTEG